MNYTHPMVSSPLLYSHFQFLAGMSAEHVAFSVHAVECSNITVKYECAVSFPILPYSIFNCHRTECHMEYALCRKSL